MAKLISYGDEARKALKKGIDAVASCVAPTIGPKGRNVALQRGYGDPTVTNDGITVAREVVLKDPFENMGADMVKAVAQKTNDEAGDGTSTSVVLTQAIVNEGIKRIQSGVNVVGVKNGIETASKMVVDALKSMATPIKDDDEVKQIATISAESEEIGEIISSVVKSVGKNGVITVDEGQSIGVISEVVQGLDFDRGFISQYMVTNPERMEAEYKDVPIMVTDYKIESVKDIVPLLDSIAQTGRRELVIIADDITGDALTTFVVNKMRGSFHALCVKAPGFGDRKKDYLLDIATTVGANFISRDSGRKVDSVILSDLGSADRVTSTKDRTIIVGGKGDKKAIDDRIAYAKAELEKSDSKHDKEKIIERIAKLSGGIAVLKVGAPTETETKYLKLKVEDAVNATKAALEEGIVPGGGSALIRAAESVKGKISQLNLSQDESIGFNIVIDSLCYPLRQIAANAGKGDGSSIVDKVMCAGKNGGYDALNDRIVEDMIKEGIIDPVKVTRNAIQNSASSASILLTTEVAMVEEPKQVKE